MFGQTLKRINQKILTYLNTITQASKRDILRDMRVYTDVLHRNQNNSISKGIVSSPEFKTVLACVMSNPITYKKFGIYRNSWFSFDDYQNQNRFMSNNVGMLNLENMIRNEILFMNNSIIAPLENSDISVDGNNGFYVTNKELDMYRDIILNHHNVSNTELTYIRNGLNDLDSSLFKFNLSIYKFNLLWRIHMLHPRDYMNSTTSSLPMNDFNINLDIKKELDNSEHF